MRNDDPNQSVVPGNGYVPAIPPMVPATPNPSMGIPELTRERQVAALEFLI